MSVVSFALAVLFIIRLLSFYMLDPLYLHSYVKGTARMLISGTTKLVSVQLFL